MRSVPGADNANGGSAVPFRMHPVTVPSFPDRLFDILGYGAVPDGVTDCTRAIEAAIMECSDTGGGRVLIPAGRWFTGPIHLKSNVELHVTEGASVRFCTDPAKYLPPVLVRWGGQECYNFSPLIYARDCENIAITGTGMLYGQGKPWWPWEKRQQRARAALNQMVLDKIPVEKRCFSSEDLPLRPQFIAPINCRNVLLEDFTIAEAGPFWTIHVIYCSDVTIRSLRIHATDGPNNDGIDIDSSRNVLIEDCQIRSSDDCIALKSGMNEDGRRVGIPTENVIIRRIRATGGQGGITIGSDMSGGVRNVYVHDCQYDGPNSGIRMKTARGRGGVVENIFFDNINIDRVSGDAIQMTAEYPSFVTAGGCTPEFRRIQIRNVTCLQAQTAARLVGLPDKAIRDLTLENVVIKADQGLTCSCGQDIRLVNVHITPRFGPALAFKDSHDVLIDGLNNSNGSNVFLDLRGHQTHNIRLRGQPPDHVRPAVVLGVDVPKDALIHE